jgi:hypothetical protein
MRFSSSARKSVCGSLAFLCLLQWSGAASTCRADGAEPVLFLKYSKPSISDESARKRFSAITAEIERRLDIRVSPSLKHQKVPGPVIAEIDDASLKSVATRVSETGRKMDRLEIRAAERDLEAIEIELRKYRFGEAIRPLMADVFLKRGTISLWDGNPASAEGFLRKARSLRPDFDPDHALYSPQFRKMWSGIGSDFPVEAEILVESIPPGARITVDGADRGSTPRRLKVPAPGPVRLRLEHPGYQPVEGMRQWIPGDSDRIELILPGDREARLALFLEANAAEIPEAGPIVSEMAQESGASRLAFLMLERQEGAEVLRILTASASSPAPRSLGSIPVPDDREGLSAAAERTAVMLAESGWPARSVVAASPGRPWYYSWWFLTGLGLLAAGTAVALGGGGGGGGGGDSSSSSSGVNF